MHCRLKGLPTKIFKKKEPSSDIEFVKVDLVIRITNLCLKEVSLKIKEGEKVAILVKQVRKIYNPRLIMDSIMRRKAQFCLEIQILINWIRKYREKIGYVPQESFKWTIRQNINLGSIKKDDTLAVADIAGSATL